MSEDRQASEDQSREEARAARRRFLKVAATGAVAVPVIDTLAGTNLLIVSAQAQTGQFQLFNGPFTGTLEDV